MLGRLALRSQLRGWARGAFIVLSVVTALLINGIYVSYYTRVQNWTKLVPGQPRVVVISPNGPLGACRDAVVRSPSVLACEPIAAEKAFVASYTLDVWTYEVGTDIVTPFLAYGQMPTLGEVAIQKELANSVGASPGSTLCLSDPQGKRPSSSPRISAIMSDPLWPTIMVASGGVQDSDGKTMLLAKLEPNTSVSRWLEWLNDQTKAAGVPLEEMTWSLGQGGLGQEARGPSGLANQLKLDLAQLILIVVALGVANAIALGLIEDEAETALLRALGVRSLEIQLIHLLRAGCLVAVGVLVSVGGACASAWALPDLVGADFGMCVVRGSVVVVAVSLCATWAVLAFWHSGSPIELLRRRPLVP